MYLYKDAKLVYRYTFPHHANIEYLYRNKSNYYCNLPWLGVVCGGLCVMIVVGAVVFCGGIVMSVGVAGGVFDVVVMIVVCVVVVSKI